MALHIPFSPCVLKNPAFMPICKKMEAVCFSTSWWLLKKRRQETGGEKRKGRLQPNWPKWRTLTSQMWLTRLEWQGLWEWFPCGWKDLIMPHHSKATQPRLLLATNVVISANVSQYPTHLPSLGTSYENLMGTSLGYWLLLLGFLCISPFNGKASLRNANHKQRKQKHCFSRPWQELRNLA